MGLVINTNQSALAIQHNLSVSAADISTNMEKLSTGLRINSASDDAAGLALSEGLKSHIKSSDVAKNNIQTGINILQVAEADMSVMQDGVQRLRDLAVQASNGVYSSAERTMIDNEFNQIIAELDRVKNSSEFSGLNLLDGSIASLTLQVGTGSTANDKIDLVATGIFADLDVTSAPFDLTTQAGAQTAIGAIDTGLETISARRATAGAMVGRLQSSLDRADTTKQNMSASYSSIRDLDMAQGAASLTASQITQQAASSMLQQANQAPAIALTLI